MKSTEKRRGVKSIRPIRAVRGKVLRWDETGFPLPPKEMSITERLFYLRERGYGIKTVGCIELANAVKQCEKETISYPEFMRRCREIHYTLESMIAQKIEEKKDNAKDE